MDCRTEFSAAIDHVERAVVFVDIVEFVRLTENDEIGTIRRWRDLAAYVTSSIAPANGGSIVGVPGDGLLLVFGDVADALSASKQIQSAAVERNQGRGEDARMHLRIGIHFAGIMLEAGNVFGHGVNLTHRITSLAGPEDIMLSRQALDRLPHDERVDFEDFGECYVKHVANPVHVFRQKKSTFGFARLDVPLLDLLPLIVVSEFRNGDPTCDDIVFGRLLADLLIDRLRFSSSWQVAALESIIGENGRRHGEQSDRALLSKAGLERCAYMIGGTFESRSSGKAWVEITSPQYGETLWKRRFANILSEHHTVNLGTIDRMSVEIGKVIPTLELARIRLNRPTNLENKALFSAAIALMHRLSEEEFKEALELWETLKSRSSRQSLVNAWLAYWYLLRVLQGWSDDPKVDGERAIQLAREALEGDPTCTFALAIDGFVQTHMLRRFEVAAERYDQAIRLKSEDPIAWLLKGTLFAFTDDGPQAVSCATKALAMSPPDATRYFYDSLAASAFLTAGFDQQALELANRSLKLNCKHTSTLRVKTVAEWRLGKMARARTTASMLARQDPSFTVSGYLRTNPSGSFRIGREVASILGKAGIRR